MPVINAMIDEGRELGEPVYQQDGTMTFEYFLATTKIVYKHHYNFTVEKVQKFKTDRRAAIAAGQDKEFKKLFFEEENLQMHSKNQIQSALYQALKVPKSVFDKTGQAFMSNPEQRETFGNAINELEKSLTGREVVELTRD